MSLPPLPRDLHRAHAFGAALGAMARYVVASSSRVFARGRRLLAFGGARAKTRVRWRAGS